MRYARPRFVPLGLTRKCMKPMMPMRVSPSANRPLAGRATPFAKKLPSASSLMQ